SPKVEYKKVWLPIMDTSPCNTTSTDVEGFINFLSNHLNRVLQCNKKETYVHWTFSCRYCTICIKESKTSQSMYVSSLMSEKGILRLRDHFTENSDVLDEIHFLALGVTEMAYMTEFVVDSCLASSHPLHYKVL
ncbi:hypothetical protein H5410_026793, partial [Solanum commersonii]